MKPLCIDLFCGLGGWSDGFIAEGWDVVGFDIERHQYGDQRYPGQLVIQDVTTLHGSQFRHAACIVASPPCQKYSYMAQPWTRAKREGRWQEWERDSRFGDRLEGLNRLFAACFRIQREACEAAGHHIPMVVENVKGAQRWVGRAAWHHGSFYLWGDVPAIMPHTLKLRKVPGFNFHQHENGGPGGSFQSAAVAELRNGAVKNEGTAGGSWFNVSHGKAVPGNQAGAPQRGDGLKLGGFNVEAARYREGQGVKQHGSGPEWFDNGIASHSRSDSRKAASAMIAKIPPDLSAYLARYYKP